MEERKEYWAARGQGEWEQSELQGAKVGAKVDAAKAAAAGQPNGTH